MRPRLLTSYLALAFAAVTVVALRASDMAGVYCLVEKVVLEPNDTEPQRIQIWGAFAMSTGERGDSYKAAQRGYLYYSCPQGHDATCWSEWADFKAVAARGEAVGFGGRFMNNGHVRKTSENPSAPDAYPIQMGLTRMGSLATHSGIIAQLRDALNKK